MCDQCSSFNVSAGASRNWLAVTYFLQMAGSLENAIADTAFADVEAGLWCTPAAEYDDLHSEIASKYIAGLSVFNFLWAAYEAAVEVAGQNAFSSDTTAIRGRKLIGAQDAFTSGMLGAGKLISVALHCCNNWPSGIVKFQELKRQYSLTGLAAGAELSRLFRNHIAHGDDTIPTPDHAWRTHAGKRGLAQHSVYRFYAVGRLLLLFIQTMAFHAVRDPDQPRPFLEKDERPRSPREVLQTVHLKM